MYLNIFFRSKAKKETMVSPEFLVNQEERVRGDLQDHLDLLDRRPKENTSRFQDLQVLPDPLVRLDYL